MIWRARRKPSVHCASPKTLSSVYFDHKFTQFREWRQSSRTCLKWLYLWTDVWMLTMSLIIWRKVVWNLFIRRYITWKQNKILQPNRYHRAVRFHFYGYILSTYLIFYMFEKYICARMPISEFYFGSERLYLHRFQVGNHRTIAAVVFITALSSYHVSTNRILAYNSVLLLEWRHIASFSICIILINLDLCKV